MAFPLAGIVVRGAIVGLYRFATGKAARRKLLGQLIRLQRDLELLADHYNRVNRFVGKANKDLAKFLETDLVYILESDVLRVSDWDDELSAAVIRGGLRRSLGKAARIVRSAARQNAPVRTGALKRSLSYKVKVIPAAAYAVVGADRKYRVPDDRRKRGYHRPASVIHLVEKGYVHRSGTQVEGKHFLRNAMVSTRDDVRRVIRNNISRDIAAEYERRRRASKRRHRDRLLVGSIRAFERVITGM